MQQIPVHPLELKVLRSLEGNSPMDFDSLVSSSKLLPDQVRRSIEWLSSKSLVEVKQTSVPMIRLMKSKIPELDLVQILESSNGKSSVRELKAKFSSDQEFSAAVGRGKQAGLILVTAEGNEKFLQIKDGARAKELETVRNLIAQGYPESQIQPRYRDMIRDFLKRELARREEEKQVSLSITDLGRQVLLAASKTKYIDELTPELITSRGWREMPLRPIDVEAPPPRFYPGRRHPVMEFINEVREAYLSMGFTEIMGDSIQPAFWNFDALFTPQDHPARELQDTFYLKDGKDRSIVRRDVVERVASTHETGWKTGSRGWGYVWDTEEARRLVLRTHNTALTAKATKESGDRETRVFTVGRVYRNENLDYKHLAELHQMEGIIIGDGLNVRHLMGFLTQFYRKLGMSGVKLWPSYFPYTEPSLQVMTYYDKVGKWLEMGGSGLFRPEVTLPLGVRKPVLAWGCGLERLLMLRLGTEDIRQLYNNDLGWLRGREEG